MSHETSLTLGDLDQWFPPCGPCAFCGFHDKRHRLWDAIIERASAGETVEGLTFDYAYPPEAIAAVLAVRPYERDRELEALL